MLHLRNPPNPETQFPRYNLKLNQNLDLNLYRETPGNLSFWIWWSLGCSNFSANHHRCRCLRIDNTQIAVNKGAGRALRSTGWRRPIWCLIFKGHFPQKSLIISGSVSENDLWLKAFCVSFHFCNSNQSSEPCEVAQYP